MTLENAEEEKLKMMASLTRMKDICDKAGYQECIECREEYPKFAKFKNGVCLDCQEKKKALESQSKANKDTSEQVLDRLQEATNGDWED